jgi:hypothetical protein
MKYLKYVGFGILGLGFVAFAIWLTMTLWNWLIPDLFNGPEIGYWQTAGLFILSKILLTGIAPGKGHDKSHDNKWKRKYMKKYPAEDARVVSEDSSAGEENQ